MNGMMRWLLDLDVIPADAEGLRLAWTHPLAAWLWAIIILACIGFACWSYSRLSGSRAARFTLAGVRTALLAFILVVLAGPALELPRENVERDWVLVLVDRSASMTIADADGIGGSRIEREMQLRDIIESNNETWAQLARDRNIVWLGFHSGAFTLPLEQRDQPANTDDADTVNSALPLLEAPTGQRTRLNAALTQALQRAAARPVSGIVVLTDGRTEDPPARSLVRRIAGDRIGVYTVPLGSAEAIGDLAIRRIEAPRRAFVSDKVPVTVELDRIGDAAGNMAMSVRLVDTQTGEELDALELEAGDDRDAVTLTATPSLTGEAEWEVVIDTERPDLIPDNNSKPMLIDLIDRPLRVLYVEGYPRWEYRFVKNLLIREASIESSVMLLSADRDFAQEGNMPIARLPRTAEEFADYDVMIIGDVPGTFFSPDQLTIIRDHIGRRGAGMLWIGGEQHMPLSYGGTDLVDLLPIRGSLTLSRIDRPVNMVPTPLADRLGIMQMTTSEGTGWPRALADPSYRWSRLQWAQRLDPNQLKPTAETLAETVTTFENGMPLPLVVMMRYGAGRSIYVATDEIWRWRFGRGEELTEQFWVQMIRMLGRESLTTAGESLALRVNPRRVEVGQPITVDVQLLDSQLVDAGRASIRAVIETPDGETVAELDLLQTPDEPERYAATYLPDRTAELRVRLDDPLLPGDHEAIVDVFTPDDELRRPAADHAVLEDLAASTGGRVLDAASVASLPELLPNRSLRTENPLTESIWDTPLALLIAILLLAAEWIGRKLVRLV